MKQYYIWFLPFNSLHKLIHIKDWESYHLDLEQFFKAYKLETEDEKRDFFFGYDLRYLLPYKNFLVVVIWGANRIRTLLTN
jgi:hypothetical protein